jgi:dCTP deaminase
MILGDKAIKEYLNQGSGVIGYKEEHINPNSVDLTLANEITMYKSGELDCRKPNETRKFNLEGLESFVLQPNRLYLVTTNETLDLRPMKFEKTICTTGKKFEAEKTICARVEGKSSLARLGMWCHITAGWIDSGFKGSLVLELAVVQPLRIYPNMKICQIAFMESTEVETHYGHKDGSKYQNQIGAQESKMYENFK